MALGRIWMTLCKHATIVYDDIPWSSCNRRGMCNSVSLSKRLCKIYSQCYFAICKIVIAYARLYHVIKMQRISPIFGVIKI
jgi:hypothetical protein